MYWLYTFLLGAGTLLASPYFVYKACTTEKYRHGLAQRMGRLPPELVEGLAGRRPLWVHAVSVGEVTAAVPLVARIQAAHPELPVLLSVVTLTGYHTAVRELPDAAAVLYFPLDFPRTVARALDALQPRCVGLVETELWPNFLRACGRRRVPVVVLNGRISDKSYPGYRRLRPFFRRVLGNVACFGMRTPKDAERIRAMGAPQERVVVTGNLKYERAVGQADGERTDRLRRAFDLAEGEPLLVAASTHRGEEEVVLEAFAGLRERHPELRLLLVPRHPERFAEAEAVIARRGMAYRKWSAAASDGDEPAPPVLLLDTMGELTAAFPLATLVFIGGSLVPVGGHNALEAAAAGKATLFGPHMHNFQQEADDLVAAGCARQVHDADSLAATCRGLLEDPAALEAMGRAAVGVVEAGRGAAERTLALLEPYLTLEAGS
jgi:3-deoxy-D-manno-octulosonic-acid transferase